LLLSRSLLSYKIVIEIKITINLFFQPPLELPCIKNKKLLPTKAEIMSYIEQYESARTKIQDTRKCITHPENVLVCYLSILYLISTKIHINNYIYYLFIF